MIKTYGLPSWFQTSEWYRPRPVLAVLKKAHCTPQQAAPDAPANQGASPHPEIFLSPGLQVAKVSSKQWIQEKSLVPADREFWRVQLKIKKKLMFSHFFCLLLLLKDFFTSSCFKAQISLFSGYLYMYFKKFYKFEYGKNFSVPTLAGFLSIRVGACYSIYFKFGTRWGVHQLDPHPSNDSLSGGKKIINILKLFVSLAVHHPFRSGLSLIQVPWGNIFFCRKGPGEGPIYF